MKLIVLILILFAVQAQAQNRIVNSTRYNVEPFTDACLSELKVTGTCVMIAELPEKINGKYAGLCRQTDAHTYVIWVHAYCFSAFAEILAHELAHVWQYEINLQVIDGYIHYKQLRYKADESRHYAHPHERDAVEIGKLLYNNNKHIRHDGSITRN